MLCTVELSRIDVFEAASVVAPSALGDAEADCAASPAFEVQPATVARTTAPAASAARRERDLRGFAPAVGVTGLAIVVASRSGCVHCSIPSYALAVLAMDVG
jgi:hypothetical protein